MDLEYQGDYSINYLAFLNVLSLIELLTRKDWFIVFCGLIEANI